MSQPSGGRRVVQAAAFSVLTVGGAAYFELGRNVLETHTAAAACYEAFAADDPAASCELPDVLNETAQDLVNNWWVVPGTVVALGVSGALRASDRRSRIFTPTHDQWQRR